MKGYKTYLIAAAAALTTAAHSLGWIDGQTYTAIMGFLGAGGLATLRAGVKTEISGIM